MSYYPGGSVFPSLHSFIEHKFFFGTAIASLALAALRRPKKPTKDGCIKEGAFVRAPGKSPILEDVSHFCHLGNNLFCGVVYQVRTHIFGEAQAMVKN